MSEHAILAPSSAARIVACPGSVKLAAMYPQMETIEAREGTAAHWAAAEILHGRVVAVGQVADNGVTLNDDMLEAAYLYSDYIESLNLISEYNIERTIRSGYLHEENWGTPDFFNYESLTLHIPDFKFGHKYVDVYRNWQLINYAALILDFLGVDGSLDQHIKVVMTIVQPRNFHRDGPIRTWSVMASELRPYFNQLRAAFDAAMQPDAKCIVNSECEYCPGRHACEAWCQFGLHTRAL